jgi:hypothetical protein
MQHLDGSCETRAWHRGSIKTTFFWSFIEDAETHPFVIFLEKILHPGLAHHLWFWHISGIDWHSDGAICRSASICGGRASIGKMVLETICLEQSRGIIKYTPGIDDPSFLLILFWIFAQPSNQQFLSRVLLWLIHRVLRCR